MFKSRAVSRKVFLPALALVLLGLFWLPWHVATRPTVSVSYLVGFNNQVAWLFLLVLVALFLFFGPRLPIPEGEEGKLSRSMLYVALVGTLLSTGFMYFLQRPLAGYGEAGYFCDRIHQLLAGSIPYRQFEFAYGAALLYVPATLARLFHVDVSDAYGIAYVLACLTGTFLLWITCQWLDGPLAGRRAAFLFVWVASLVSTLNYGLNYSLFRFIFPVFWVLFVYGTARRRGLSSLAPYATTVIGFALMSLISPELALALASGSMLSLAVLGGLRSSGQVALFAGTSVILVAMCSLAFKLGVFRTMFAIRGGYFNFPVLPSPYILLLLIAAAITSCLVGTQLSQGRFGTALPLLCYALPATAAALGRCDGGHVLLNGLPLYLCGIVATYDTRFPGRAFTWCLWLAYFVPVALILPSVVDLVRRSFVPAVFALEPNKRTTRFDQLVLRHKERELGAERGKAAFLEARAAAKMQPAPDLDHIFGQPVGTIFEVPFNFEIEGYGRYKSPVLDSGFFMSMTNLGTIPQVQEKINELRSHPGRPLLLPPHWELSCSADIESDTHGISTLLLFPFRPRMVHQENVNAPFCRYIQQHYLPSVPADASHLHYGLWTANED